MNYLFIFGNQVAEDTFGTLVDVILKNLNIQLKGNEQLTIRVRIIVAVYQYGNYGVVFVS